MDDRPTTLLAAGRMFWRSFAPAWVFPAVLLPIFLVSEKIGHPLLIWWLVEMPLFFWCFLRATRPWLDGRIRYSHQAFWGVVVPFLVWVAIAGLHRAMTVLLMR